MKSAFLSIMVSSSFPSKLLAFCLLAGLVSADAKEPPSPNSEAKPGAEAKKGEAPSEDSKKKDVSKAGKAAEPVVTEHEVTLANGEVLVYEATTGYLELKNEEGKTRARVFSVAYTVKPAEEGAGERPVVFCFNGGPGASAVWLHLGALGPRIVTFPEDGTAGPAPPASVEPNPQTLLEVADLVFVDPVSTGYSRATEAKKAREFHGFDPDIESVSEFIRLWITEHERWAAPKYLLGESYGAIRVSAVAKRVQSRFGMYLNGVVLLSGLLDFGTLLEAEGNDLPYVAFFPSYATTAHYHGQLGEALQAKPVDEVADEARAFAQGPYATALLRGNRLLENERAAVTERFVELSGLDADFVRRSGLRVDPSSFRKRLLWDEEKMIGRFDARVVTEARAPAFSFPLGDPSFDILLGGFSSGFNAYVRRELKFEDEAIYEILSPLVRPWSYGSFENEYVSVTESLEAAMQQNRYLRVLVNCGYHDLATPFGGMEHSLSQMDLPEALRSNIDVTYYPGGHMMYTVPASLEALARDLKGFVTGEDAGQDDAP